MANFRKPLTRTELIFLIKHSSFTTACLYPFYEEFKNPNSQVNKEFFFSIRYHINKEDELMRLVIADFVQRQIKLDIEHEEIIEKARKHEEHKQSLLRDANIKLKEELLKEIAELQRLINKRNQLYNSILQTLSEIMNLSLIVIEQKIEVITIKKDRDEKTLILLDCLTQKRFEKIEVRIELERDPERKIKMYESLQELKRAHNMSKQYEDEKNLEEILKQKGEDATPERILHEKLIHREFEFIKEGKKILERRLLSEEEIKNDEKRVKNFKKSFDDKIDQKEFEIKKIEKTIDQKVEKLKDESEQLKDVDNRIKHFVGSDNSMSLQISKIVEKESPQSSIINVPNSINTQNLIKREEAENIFYQIEGLDLDMTTEEVKAYDKLQKSICRMSKNPPMSITEYSDCIGIIIQSIRLLQKNPTLWAILSSFANNLVSQLPQETSRMQFNSLKI
jgi:hypothetical protein